MSAALHAPRDLCVDLSQLRFADPSLMIDLAMVAQRLRMSGRGLRLGVSQGRPARLFLGHRHRELLITGAAAGGVMNPVGPMGACPTSRQCCAPGEAVLTSSSTSPCS